LTTTIRLARLHLVSRRVPASLVALAVVAVALRVALRWTPASGASSVMFPLIMAAAAAAVISVTTHSPLDEPERVTGSWLPWLRFSRPGRRRGYGRPARSATEARPSAPAWSLRPDLPPSPCAAPASGPDQGSSTTAIPCVPCWSRTMAAAASASG